MKLAAIQHDIVWEDRDANFARLTPMIADAAAAGAELALLTEMYSVGFTMATDRVAEPVDGPSTQFLVDQAAAHGMWVCGSVPELPPAQSRPFNRAVLAGPQGTVHRYAKIHPFTYAGEHEHYAPGDQRVTVEVAGVRISIFVCYDLRFADEFWAVGPATDLFVVVANWPAARRLHWNSLLQARAIENQCYVAAVNRVGHGDGLEYAGDSRIIDPMGDVLAEAGADEKIIFADVDPAHVGQVRAALPFLADRR